MHNLSKIGYQMLQFVGFTPGLRFSFAFLDYAISKSAFYQTKLKYLDDVHFMGASVFV